MSRVQSLVAMVFVASAACGPEAQLFEKVTGKDRNPEPRRSVEIAPAYTDPGSYEEPDCTQPYYLGKLCFDEERLRFTITTAGTPMAPIGANPASEVSLVATSDAVVPGDSCLVPLAPEATPAPEAAVVTVEYKAVMPPDEYTPTETVTFANKQSFVYQCDAEILRVVVHEPYGFAEGTSITVSYAATHGSYVATSPVFVGSGAKSSIKDLDFASGTTTAGGPPAADACPAGVTGDAELVHCHREKRVNFVYDAVVSKGIPVGAAPVAAVTVTITADGVSSSDACLAVDPAPTGALPAAGRLSVDWRIDPDAADAASSALGAVFVYGCSASTIVFVLDAALVAGNRYELVASYDSAATSFVASSGPMRGAAETDQAVDVPLTPLHVR